MLFYDLIFQYRLLLLDRENPLAIRNDEPGKADKWQKVLRGMNDSLKDLRENQEESLIFATHGEDGRIHFHVSCKGQEKCFLKVTGVISSFLTERYHVVEARMHSMQEITAEMFQIAIRKAVGASTMDENAYCLFSDMKIDYLDNDCFKVSEMISPAEKLSLETALKKTECFMSPASYTEELHRIYSSENERKFYGHPVHYKITAGSREIAQDMIRLLVQALYSNQRILGTRISTIYDMDDDCYEVNDLKHLFERAKGTTVVLEFCGVHGENVVYDPSYKKVAEYASELVLQYSNDVLIIIVEIAGPTGLLSMLMKEFDSTMDIVELAEGKGTREQAMEYLNRLVDESRYTQFRDQSLAEALPAEKEYFKPWEIRESFEAWCKNNLKRKIYRAYDIKPAVLPKEEPKEKTKEANEEEKEKAYDKLQAMVGLKEVKEVIDRIIVSHKMQKVRKEMGLKQETFSYHMLFTGNPGSAKTTVARLLAEILEEEGILSTGDFVECGRSDLVGKYVGWTAKQVKSKFREADGGVLFIDEAYALVDDENSFGDEAINTIVQEMENNRDDVIVIFAGYPEKMLDFLDKNEGLRSRIAFHIDFPDYNAEEMTDILKLMAEEKGYHIDTAIEKKCMDIFADACSQPEFGNGRYVRNLLEQAIMKQSVRVFQETKGKKLDKQALVTMDVSDFEINAIPQKEKKPVIGFVI